MTRLSKTLAFAIATSATTRFTADVATDGGEPAREEGKETVEY